jgi:hypothetical protein
MEEKMSAKIAHAVIGGLSDGTTVMEEWPPPVIELKGQQYLGIDFSPNNDGKRITIYMLAGMAPGEAVATWMKRQGRPESVEGFVEFCQTLVDTRDDEIAAEGVESFLEICERAHNTLSSDHRYSKHMKLIVGLGIKISEVREKFVRGAVTATPRVNREMSPQKHPEKADLASPPAHTNVAPHPNPMGAIPLPKDPDDEPW